MLYKQCGKIYERDGETDLPSAYLTLSTACVCYSSIYAAVNYIHVYYLKQNKYMFFEIPLVVHKHHTGHFKNVQFTLTARVQKKTTAHNCSAWYRID